MKNYNNYHNYNSFDKKLSNGKKIFEIAKTGFNSYKAMIDGNVDTSVIIEQAYNPYSEKKEERIIKCDMDVKVNIRSMIYLLERDEIYIVITEIDDNRVYKYFKAVKANNTLKWQDKYLKVHEIPVYASYSTSLSSDGLLKGSDMVIANDQAKVILPRYEPALDIPIGKRLIFNHSKRSIFTYVRAEELGYDGVLSMALKVELYNENVDNLDLNLANVNESEPSPPISNYDIRVTNDRNRISKGGYGIVEFEILKDGIVVVEPINVSVDKTNIAQFIEQISDNEIVLKGLEFGDFVMTISLVNNSSIYLKRNMSVAGV